MFRFFFIGNVPESGTQERRSGNRRRSEASCTGIRYAGRIWERAAIGRKLYRNPVRKEDLGIGNDRKKVVPESGTQRGSGNRQQSEEKVVPESGTQRESENRQQSEESCTGIRYEERNRERATIGSKLYRNPICREGLGTGSD